MAIKYDLRSNGPHRPPKRKKRNVRWRRRRHDLAYVGALTLYRLGNVIRRPCGLLVFGLLGRIAGSAARSDRRRILDNLRQVYGREWSQTRIASVARAVYPSLAKNLFDAIYLARCSDREFDRLITCDSLQPLNAALEQGTGAVMITAHLGCYESLLHFFARKGYPSFAIGRRAFDKRVDSIIQKLRSGPNIIYMNRDGSSRKIIRLLREGRLFGALIDQDTNVEGVFADFLGRLAYTPSAPVRIAMRFGVPVFVATTARRLDGRHHISLIGPLRLRDAGDFQKDLVYNVQTANDLISDAIRHNPEQWVWMHKRWKRRPDSPRHAETPNIEKYRLYDNSDALS